MLPGAAPVLPDAEYVVLSSRLIPGMDGGYTIATLTRARQLAEAGVAEGAGPQLLTFDPGTAADHAAQRRTFAEQGRSSTPHACATCSTRPRIPVGERPIGCALPPTPR